jgi:hypothetical protein
VVNSWLDRRVPCRVTPERRTLRRHNTLNQSVRSHDWPVRDLKGAAMSLVQLMERTAAPGLCRRTVSIATSLLALMLAVTVALNTATAQVPQPPRQLVPPPPPPNPPALPAGSLCLADNPANPPLALLSTAPVNLAGRDLNGSVSWIERLTNGQCRAGCANSGYSFSGTQSGAYCFCGNAAGAFGLSTRCGTRCTGSTLEACGGPNANTVMQTGVVTPASLSPLNYPNLPPFGTQMPVAPPNGAQCVIDVAGFAYRHFELHTWAAGGPPTPTTNGLAFPLTWTVTGGGFHQDLSSVSGQTQIDNRVWTLDGIAPAGANSAVTWVTINKAPAGSGVTFGPSGTGGLGGLHEWQAQSSNGSHPTPKLVDGPTYELNYGTIPGADWSSPRPHHVDLALNDGNKGTLHLWRPGSTGWIHCQSNIP